MIRAVKSHKLTHRACNFVYSKLAQGAVGKEIQKFIPQCFTNKNIITIFAVLKLIYIN